MNVMKSIGTTVGLAALLFAGACGGGGGEGGAAAPADTGGDAGGTQQAAAPAPPSGGEMPSGTSSITGTVKFEGKAPNLRPIKMDADPGCAMKHTEDVYPETIVLGDGNTMGNVWVTITEGLGDTTWAVPSEPVVMDQRGCKYIPHVTTAMAGQPFKFLNNDGVLHNVHALPEENKEFNKAMPATVVETDHVFTKPESMFKVKCDVHPWMTAYVAVTSHPFNAVTGEDGTFTIEGLKAGTYTVQAWHERLGTQTATVTVAEGAAASQDFTFKPPTG